MCGRVPGTRMGPSLGHSNTPEARGGGVCHQKNTEGKAPLISSHERATPGPSLTFTFNPSLLPHPARTLSSPPPHLHGWRHPVAEALAYLSYGANYQPQYSAHRLLNIYPLLATSLPLLSQRPCQPSCSLYLLLV